MMDGFFSNNALYSASISITKFIFLLNLFNTWLLLFRIKSLADVASKSITYKEECNVVLQSSKYEEITLTH